MERSIYTTVVALEITSRHSRYAFSFKHEFETDPLKIHVNRGWNSGNRHCISLKIPTCILLDNNKDIIDFGYEAFNKYQEICFDEDRACYYFFDRPFKVVENNMYQVSIACRYHYLTSPFTLDISISSTRIIHWHSTVNCWIIISCWFFCVFFF